MLSPLPALSLLIDVAGALASSTLQLLNKHVADRQAALQVLVLLVETTVFSLLFLVLISASFALAVCLFLHLAVLFRPSHRGRAAALLHRQLSLVDDELPADDELTRWMGGGRRPETHRPRPSGVAFLTRSLRRSLAAALRWQLCNFDSLADEHDPSFVKWVEDHGDLIVTHIGRSGPYVVINRAILLTLGDDGVVESFYERPTSTYVARLGKQSWVNCCLMIRLCDFDKAVQWRRDRRWMYVLFTPSPF
ncbi:hypothetical protein EVJ58_g8663 [Rhodofomes roseus]|uniref:Uncharacterized protein n=1 Tax=Rhodofomes roseus TaxID=34475 RepID=A0A4Y9XY95_9APHY|nr:hypothetical protein EVJ58_g8663 [Rhodofomes roseus]